MREKKVCRLPDCNRTNHTRGLCSMHNHRLERHGDTSTVIDRTESGNILKTKYGDDYFKKLSANGRLRRVETHPEYDPSRVDNSLMDIKKFADKFDITEGGCWQWGGALFWDGYAKLKLRHGIKRAHRWFYHIFFNTIIPDNQVCDHLCLNKKCVNPYHLEIVTSGENTRRYHRTKLSKGLI